MNLEELYIEARKAPRSGRTVRCTDKWMPIVRDLRGKNYTYEQIWTWLKDRGQDVHAKPQTFASAESRRFRRWLSQQ